jgi:hypothetical protein
MPPPPVLPMLKIEQLRLAALSRLRTAVAAANADAVGSLWALKGLYIPQHRFEKLKPEQAPFCHVAAKSDGGAGNSHELPQFDLVGTLHINVFHASTRSGAVDLDTQASQVAQSICLALLEDSTFLELIGGWVQGLRFTIDDGVAKGDQGSEYDCVLVQIELEMAMGQELFEPVSGVLLSRITTQLALGDEAQSIPAQSLVVKEQIDFP